MSLFKLRNKLCPALLLSLASAASAATPRLLVVISVDQMRAEFLDRAATGGGLDRIKRAGAVFTQARHGHAPTETCPGHAAILTGRYPSETGIVSNDWWTPADHRSRYCAEDALFGRSPRSLEAYTLGDALKARRPESKVVSVSIKDRAAIMLGGQRPDYAVWFDKKEGAFTTSGYYARPRWLGKLNDALRKRGAPLEGVAASSFTQVAESPVGDELVLRAALEALKRERLGRGAGPDLLAISFSATDFVGHQSGGDGPEMAAQLISLDDILKRLLEALDDGVGDGRWALALTADHGSTPKPGSPRAVELGLHELTYAELDRRLESALQYHYPSKTRWLDAEYFPHIWLSTSAAAAAATGLDRSQLLHQAAKLLAGVEDMAAVYVPGELPADDPYVRAFARTEFPGRMGDLMLRLKPEAALTDPGKANHGSVYELDARVPLVFVGAGFKRGVYDEPASVVDLAPTAAAAIGLPFTGGRESRTLTRALDR